jgi:hypothetical protein
MKLLDIILILFLLCCCILKNKEGFSIAGQLIIPPLQYRILQPTTSYYETSICEDDNNWTNGDLKCGDYFIEGYDCEDIGDDDRQAFEACKRTCDNCPVDVQLKETDNKMLDRFPDKRIPSPVSELDNFDFADYGEFDGMMGSGSDVGMNAELYSKIDDLTTIVKELKGSYGNMGSMGGGSNEFVSCSGATCENIPDFEPSECNSKIKGLNFGWGNSRGENDKYYPLQCGGVTVQANVVDIVDVGGTPVDRDIYYDCENKSWVTKNGDEYEHYQFRADYTCSSVDGALDGALDVSSDCFQEWSPCTFDAGVCAKTYVTKAGEVGSGNACIIGRAPDTASCIMDEGMEETCRPRDISDIGVADATASATADTGAPTVTPTVTPSSHTDYCVTRGVIWDTVHQNDVGVYITEGSCGTGEIGVEVGRPIPYSRDSDDPSSPGSDNSVALFFILIDGKYQPTINGITALTTTECGNLRISNDNRRLWRCDA